ncbi:hypothetical protein BJ170DRAFT_435314 [Xylariales sp. AK1849]|nr:hypothetical protein BJ170DRAFT_435314 [Xylariales sp. AK1849]
MPSTKLLSFSHTLSSLFIPCTLFFLAIAERQCYFPSGAVHSLGTPCDPDALGASPCCEATHTCLSNGLCWDTVANHVVRGGCTDSSFKDAACPSYCNKEDGVHSTSLSPLRQCDGQDDLWSCRDNVTSCNATFTVSPGRVDDKRNSSLNNVIFARGNETIASDTDEADITRRTALEVGLKTGLGMGLPLSVALAVSLWILLRTKRELAGVRRDLKKQMERSTTNDLTSGSGKPNPHEHEPHFETRTASPQELNAEPPLLEMPPPDSITSTPTIFYAP